jgi:hypothetical protein
MAIVDATHFRGCPILLLTPKFSLLFESKAIFSFLFLRILNCWTTSLGAKVKTLCATPLLTSQPPVQLFKQLFLRCILQAAICKVQLLLRRCGRRCCGVGGVERNGMPHVLFMLIYPGSIENALREKIEKLLCILI